MDPATTDGRDLSPWLLGEENKELKDITFVRYNNWAGAFTDRYKLVFDTTGKKPWLIDLEKNPTEQVNSFDNPEYKKIIHTLTQELQVYAKQYKDDIVLSDNVQSQINKIL